MTTRVYDDIGTVVARVRAKNVIDYVGLCDLTTENALLAPFYMYGHNSELNSRLLERGKSKTLKYRKYPLIALRLDVDEENQGNGMVKYSLNIGIFAYTKEHLNSEERIEQVFKPILYPLYESFLTELRNSGLFTWAGSPTPKHVKTDRPFWGTQDSERNLKKIFTDPLDCVEIQKLELFKPFNC